MTLPAGGHPSGQGGFVGDIEPERHVLNIRLGSRAAFDHRQLSGALIRFAVSNRYRKFERRRHPARPVTVFRDTLYPKASAASSPP